MVLHVTQSLENVHVQPDGWAQFAMKSVKMENMDKTAEIFADAKTVSNAFDESDKYFFVVSRRCL